MKNSALKVRPSTLLVRRAYEGYALTPFEASPDSAEVEVPGYLQAEAAVNAGVQSCGDIEQDSVREAKRSDSQFSRPVRARAQPGAPADGAGPMKYDAGRFVLSGPEDLEDLDVSQVIDAFRARDRTGGVTRILLLRAGQRPWMLGGALDDLGYAGIFVVTDGSDDHRALMES